MQLLLLLVVYGDLSHPLLVMPLDPAKTTAFSSPVKHVEPEGTKPYNLLGAEYQLFEDSVWGKKMMQKSSKLVHVAGSEPSHLQMPSLSPSESSKNLFLSRQRTQETDQKAIGMEVLQNQLKLQHADLIFAAVKDPSNIHLLVICSNGLEKIYSCFSN
ncbi:hypothetical protein RHMOL_Rhmol01G0053100 [Rhododendron molle]|uniref:Uncharacterized protein n=1 Tax=Rhododendron molle TaxID=49168 RepID=A0ACC0PZU3_RHOML|nr:hypothetical protein RHMOL_Rhmol01G0053100 [Rhododendron molle]